MFNKQLGKEYDLQILLHTNLFPFYVFSYALSVCDEMHNIYHNLFLHIYLKTKITFFETNKVHPGKQQNSHIILYTKTEFQ